MKKAEKGASVNKGVGDFAIWFVAEGRETARRSSQQRDPRKKKKKKTEMMLLSADALSHKAKRVWVLGLYCGVGLVSSSAKHFE